MYDVVVIGGGSAGRSIARAAAQVGARVALVEKQRGAGDKSDLACWPSKGLVQAAKLAHQLKGTTRFGISTVSSPIDFAAVMAHVHGVALKLAERDRTETAEQKGIEFHHGSATFTAYDTVEVDGALLPSHRFIIATGSRAAIPVIPGLADSGYLDTESIWGISSLPKSLIVITTEPVGLELAQCFARLGSNVTVLTESTAILPRDDPEASALVTKHLTEEGLTIRTAAQVTKVESRGAEKTCTFRDTATGADREVGAAAILVVAGRVANVEGLNLEAIGIHTDPVHGIEVDEYLQTHSTRVYAAGDVLMKHFSAHVALQEATVAFQNAVLRIRKKMDYTTIPWATFTDPEVAGVGITEERAKADELPCRAFRVELGQVDRAVIDGCTAGFAKVVASPAGKILGASVAGLDSSMVIHEIALAMARGVPLQDLAAAVPIYPSYGSVPHQLAVQARAGKLEKGYIQKALKIFYGFIPQGTAGNGPSDSGPAQAARAPEAQHGPAH
jgi:pyruvate/2-oxoglutarate dehydrogenase complex dihydrolipoamide dehydrogenase (E3) component